MEDESEDSRRCWNLPWTIRAAGLLFFLSRLARGSDPGRTAAAAVFAFFAGPGIRLSASLQPSKNGDMACVRGASGAQTS